MTGLAQSIVYVFIPFRCVNLCRCVYVCLVQPNFHHNFPCRFFSPSYYYPFIAMIRSNFCCYYYNNNGEYNLLQTMFISSNFISVRFRLANTLFPFFVFLHGFSFEFRFEHTPISKYVYFSAWPHRK